MFCIEHALVKVVLPIVFLFVQPVRLDDAMAVAGERPTGFARRQLDQMCDDRPDMSEVLASDDPVYRWAERCLDVGQNSLRIYWVSLEPDPGFLALHSANDSYFPAQVRITSDENLSGEDRWLLLVFELHNCDNGAAFRKLSDALWFGTITADQYANKFLLLELSAEVRTKKFLERYVPPSHRLAGSRFYEHYMSQPDKAPENLSDADRDRCKGNLERSRRWAKHTLELRASY